MKVRFHYADKQLSYSPKAELKEMVASIFKKEKKALSHIDYVFCSDEYLLGINQNYLKHDYYTDIITFPLSGKGQPVEAEVYVSLDRVKENARTLNTLFAQELKRVLAHGALHLCGYKDKSKADKEVMRSKEDTYIY